VQEKASAMSYPSAVERPPRNHVSWTLTDTIIGTVLTLVPLLALNLYDNSAANTSAVSTKPLTHQQDLTLAIITFVLTSVLEAIFLIAPLYYARKRARREGFSGTQELGLRGFNAAQAIGLLALSVVGFYALSIVYSAIATKLKITAPTNLDQLSQQIHQMPLTIQATLLASVLVAPICEEIFFRGYLLMGLARAMPSWLAIVLTSLIFAAAHASPGSFVLLFVLAIFLGILRVSTGSLWPGIALHMLNNALGFYYLFAPMK
jgi:membrane protease YdiL (CAAX protease family)